MTTEAKPRKSLSRRIRRALLLAVLLLVALFIATPYLISIPVVSQRVLHRLFADVHGTVTAERLDFGWFSPPRIFGFEIHSPDGEPVISINSIQLEQPLWQLLSHPAEVGHIDIDEPHAYLIITKNGSNFAATFKPDPNRRAPARWRQEAMRVAVDRAAFTWQLAGSSHQWSLGGMKLGVELLPAWLTETHEARFEIESRTVVDHAELSTGMCQDVLKFIAPVLAGATTSNGSFSLKLTGGSIPSEHLRDAQLQGALTLHSVNIGAGPWYDRVVPMINKLLPTLTIPREVNLARESVVEFQVADQRVHHSGLEFGTSELHVRTSGYVGFDESLDLVAEVQLQLADSTVANLPVVRAINGRVMRLPIKGTLKHPEFDWGSRPDLKQSIMAVLNGTILPEAAARLPEDLKSGGILAAPPGESSAMSDLGVAAGEMLKQFAERRRERLKKRAEERALEQQKASGDSTQPADNNPPSEVLPTAPLAPPADNSSAPPPPGTSAPTKRGTLMHVLNAIVTAAAEAADEPAPPPAASSAQPPTPGPVAPLPAAAAPSTAATGPSLSPPANSAPPPNTAAPASSAPQTIGATTPPVTASPPATAAQAPTPPRVVPPPPLLQTPLPGAGATAPPNAVAPPMVAAPPASVSPPASIPPPANQAVVPPPGDQPPPRRIFGRALRAILQSAADPNAPPTQPDVPPPGIVAPPPGSAGSQSYPAPPATAGLPPPANAPPAAADNPRRQALRRLLRAGIDAALDAAAQPPAVSPPQTPTPAVPAPETLPTPSGDAPKPAPAPE